jgi:hypothetical protein
MARKKIDPKFAVKDDSIKVEKFPSHDNETPMNQTMKDDGTIEYTPTDPFCSVKIKGYYNDGSISGYEIVAKRYEKRDLVQWEKSKKWELVGYITPFSFHVRWTNQSPWLGTQVGQLVRDIQAYEAVMKERIRNGLN